jgi:hypothetical protein
MRIRVAGEDSSLDHILQFLPASKEFQKYLVSEHAEESILFLNSVQRVEDTLAIFQKKIVNSMKKIDCLRDKSHNKIDEMANESDSNSDCEQKKGNDDEEVINTNLVTSSTYGIIIINYNLILYSLLII